MYEAATSPMFLKCNLDTFNLQSLNIKFDVLLVEPPLEEYQLSLGISSMKLWNWQEVSFFDIFSKIFYVINKFLYSIDYLL